MKNKKEIDVQHLNLDALTSYHTSHRTMRMLTIGAIFGLIATVVIMFFISSQKMMEASEKVYVMDAEGMVYPATFTQETNYQKQVEYHNHVKLFLNTWYAFDEGNYDANIQQGLYLLGDCGVQMKETYEHIKIKDQLLQKNLRYTVNMQDCMFDFSTAPPTGVVTFTQTVTRGADKSSRTLTAEFFILDEGISRTYDNPHGVKIESWTVLTPQAEEAQQQ